VKKKNGAEEDREGGMWMGEVRGKEEDVKS